MSNEAILKFDEVSFGYVHNKLLLDEVSFRVRRGAKLTLMGQNGAGKSSLFKLISGELQPIDGQVNLMRGVAVATSMQVMARENLSLSVAEYFAQAFSETPPNLLSQVSKILQVVNLEVSAEHIIGQLSGGQQARLLLAFALIQNPDILLLDEPTNNLDAVGIDHLIDFLINYDKTVIVISHDANFLNCFTEGVLYLDVFTKKIEVYQGDYFSVVEEIAARIAREQKQNAQLEKRIQDRKDKVNFFAHKGGKMRRLAKKLKEETAELEEDMVEVRREDKTIRKFTITTQQVVGEVIKMVAVNVVKNGKVERCLVDKSLYKGDKMLISGPNGIGKSSFLKSLVTGNDDVCLVDDLRVGYYSQDFANLNYDQTVLEVLRSVALPGCNDQQIRAIAAGFLLSGFLMDQKVTALSEGQKGLLSLARLVIMEPGLLILDEPTNHINFRHIPIMIEALNQYQGAMIVVSHMEEFTNDIKFNEWLALDDL